MLYHQQYLRRLDTELAVRFEELQRVLQVPSRGFAVYEDNKIEIDGMSVRLAVDSFKAILSEIRRLK